VYTCNVCNQSDTVGLTDIKKEDKLIDEKIHETNKNTSVRNRKNVIALYRYSLQFYTLVKIRVTLRHQSLCYEDNMEVLTDVDVV